MGAHLVLMIMQEVQLSISVTVFGTQDALDQINGLELEINCTLSAYSLLGKSVLLVGFDETFIMIYFVFYFDIKNLIYFCVPCVWYVLCGAQGVCVCRQVWHLYLSTWNVTKHGDWSLSPTGINWVSGGVGIDFTEYMRCRGVRFFGSLERMVIVDF